MSVFEEPKVDAHCHLLDPQRFPYAADVAYRPVGQEVAPLEQYLAAMDAYGIRHALFVGPNSGYGLDNRCMLDALARHRDRFRGVAVVRNDSSFDSLAELKGAGVVGVAFNATVMGTAYYQDAAPLLQRLAALGMFVQVQAEHAQWLEMEPLLMRSDVRVLIDHGGRPLAGAGVDQPGFQCVLRLARSGRAAVKLSGYQKYALQPPPYDDARPFIDALLQGFGPGACMWASDWPFLKAPQRLDVGPLVTLLAKLVPDAAQRRQVWWETPRRWMGLDRADRHGLLLRWVAEPLSHRATAPLSRCATEPLRRCAAGRWTLDAGRWDAGTLAVIASGHRRDAARGTRDPARPRRSPLALRRSDSPALLADRSRRETRCARFAQTISASQMLKLAPLADRTAALLGASHVPGRGCRVPLWGGGGDRAKHCCRAALVAAL